MVRLLLFHYFVYFEACNCKMFVLTQYQNWMTLWRMTGHFIGNVAETTNINLMLQLLRIFNVGCVLLLMIIKGKMTDFLYI